MKTILRCTLCLTLAACMMTPNMNPVAIQVTARPSRFVGDTLILAVQSAMPAIRSAMAATMRTAFPAAVVPESLVDTLSSPRRVLITATLVRYGPSWGGARGWTGHTGIDVFVYDHRVSPGNRFVDMIRTSSSSGAFFSVVANKTPGDVSRASFDSANLALISFLDSLDDPRAREKLRLTAGVSEAEYAPYLAPNGKSSLAGKAFITTDGGSVQPAVGQPVTLDPATSSSRRWYNRVGMVCGSFDSASPDDLFRRTRRRMVTDADGNFTFSGLPPGTYFVRTGVLWDAPEPTDLFHTITRQYALVSSTVTFKDGERKQITLSQTGNAYLRCPSLVRGRS
jgi:hypothetical protein